MKKLFRTAFLLLCLPLFIFSTCDTGEEEEASLNLSCGSSMPSGFHCITAAGKSTTTTYDIPELFGSWDSDDFDFCVKYNSDGTGTITYKPSAFVTGSVQRIKWGAMVNSKGELLVSGSGTNYIAHESLDGTPVDAQITLLSFKRSTKQWYGFDLVSVSSCPTASGGSSGTGGSGTGGSGTGGTGTGTTTGQIMFWTASDQGCGNITVTVSGSSGVISKYYASRPSCGASGCATFTLPAGTYSFTASCSKYTWSDSGLTVTAGGCFTMQLN